MNVAKIWREMMYQSKLLGLTLYLLASALAVMALNIHWEAAIMGWTIGVSFLVGTQLLWGHLR